MASGRVIIVFGAKGGIGKTIVAINLAVALAQETGKRVALVDSNTRFGDVDILLDIAVKRSIIDLAMSGEQIDRASLQACLYNHNSGITVLPSPFRRDDWRSVEARHIEAAVNVLRESHDYVVVDTAGTFNDIVARALEMATLIVLVSTPETRNLEDTRLAVDMLRSWNFDTSRVKLVLVATNDSTRAVPQDAKRILDLTPVCTVPYDRNISQASQLGTVLVVSHPDSGASKSMVALARALAQRDHLKAPVASAGVDKESSSKPSDRANRLRPGDAVDQIAGATGRFGYDASNPIPGDACLYCVSLRCPRDHAFWFERRGSYMDAPDGHITDRIQLTCFGGENETTLFFDMYHPGSSNLSPEGLSFGPAEGRGSGHSYPYDPEEPDTPHLAAARKWAEGRRGSVGTERRARMEEPKAAIEFSKDDWETLQFSPLWVFTAVAGADGRVDEEEFASLLNDIRRAEIFQSKFIRGILLTLADNLDAVQARFRADIRGMEDGLGEVRRILESKIPADEAHLFKGGLLAIGRNVAMASGGSPGTAEAVSEEEKKALDAVARLLSVSP